MHAMGVRYPQRQDEGIRFPVARIIGGCELLDLGARTELSLLGQQETLLTIGYFFQVQTTEILHMT